LFTIQFLPIIHNNNRNKMFYNDWLYRRCCTYRDSYLLLQKEIAKISTDPFDISDHDPSIDFES